MTVHHLQQAPCHTSISICTFGSHEEKVVKEKWRQKKKNIKKIAKLLISFFFFFLSKKLYKLKVMYLLRSKRQEESEQLVNTSRCDPPKTERTTKWMLDPNVCVCVCVCINSSGTHLACRSRTSSAPASFIFRSLMTDSFLYFLSVSSLQEASSSVALLWSCWLLTLWALSRSWRSCSVCCWSLPCN